jgi:hypothetical protein
MGQAAIGGDRVPNGRDAVMSVDVRRLKVSQNNVLGIFQRGSVLRRALSHTCYITVE